MTAPGPSEFRDPETSTVYCRELGCRASAGSPVPIGYYYNIYYTNILPLLLLFLQPPPWKKKSVCRFVNLTSCCCLHLRFCLTVVPDVLQLWLNSFLLHVKRAAACCVSALAHFWQVCRGQVHLQAEGRRGGTVFVETAGRDGFDLIWDLRCSF